MTVPEILSQREHRPWKLPSGNWKYYQEWNNAVFLHWQVDYGELRKLVPEVIEIDLFEAQAWVSLVAFTMERVRPKNLPAFAPVSDFHEINIRTYVKFNNKSGVYFLSIEGGTRISCQVANILSGLPYRYSKMNRQESIYHSLNTGYSDKLKMEFKVGPKLNDKTELDKWLTERYALIQDHRDTINQFEIHHVEWPIYEVDLTELKLDYPRFQSLLNHSPNLTHYSPGVQVLAWDKKKF